MHRDVYACQVEHLRESYKAFVRARVHRSVGNDPLLLARHASLIASHLVGGIVAAVVFAGYFCLTGAPGAAAILACLCFVSQILIAEYLSRTGKLERAHLLSAANLTALVMLAAGLSGGAASFALAWLVLVPLEAALSADRRVMVLATVLAVAALVCIHIATLAGAIPPRTGLPYSDSTLTLLAILGAIAYAGALAASVQEIHRGSQRTIEESREAYRLIAENANDLLTRHEASGEVAFASLASRTLLGCEPEQLIGRGFAGLLAAEERDRYEQAIAGCFRDGKPVAQELRLVRRSAEGTSTEVWLEMRCQPVPPAAGAASSHPTVIAVTRDITQRKAEMAEVARARDEAERTSRAKTAFLATMSHELRTPLNSIIGFSELLHRELLIKAREPRHAEYCRLIHQSGEHLLGLVKDLLDVSKIESGKLSVLPEPTDIADIVSNAVATMRPIADGKKITLACSAEANLPEAIADRRAVRQIVINLVSNACKFTPAGGRVEVCLTSAGTHVELAVSDTGIGIPPEHLVKLGQPFYQIDTRYARQNEGAGLGLSIVRGLMELHGGSLSVESEAGRGSRFSVRFEADEPLGDDTPAFEPVAVEGRILDLAAIQARRAAAAIEDAAHAKESALAG